MAGKINIAMIAVLHNYWFFIFRSVFDGLSHRDEEVVISLDSSGVKVSNRGERMGEKWKLRRGWRKVHIAVNEKGNRS